VLWAVWLWPLTELCDLVLSWCLAVQYACLDCVGCGVMVWSWGFELEVQSGHGLVWLWSCPVMVLYGYGLEQGRGSLGCCTPVHLPPTIISRFWDVLATHFV
jgi:hypothetical protein